jgi:hypothetical protein
MNKLAILTWLKGLSTSLFPHAKTVRYVLTGFVIVLIVALATHCRKAEAESAIAFEAGVQYLRGPAAAVVLGTRWDAPGDGNWEAGLVLVGRNPNDRGVAGGQVLYIDGFGRFDIGIGLAYFNRVPDLLGSNLNFSLMLGYRLTDRWAVNVRHWSNSGTTESNTGLDVITLSYRFGPRP